MIRGLYLLPRWNGSPLFFSLNCDLYDLAQRNIGDFDFTSDVWNVGHWSRGMAFLQTEKTRSILFFQALGNILLVDCGGKCACFGDGLRKFAMERWKLFTTVSRNVL